MKITSNVISLWVAIAMILVSLVACDTRPIPGDHLLATYNSDNEITKRFIPMDTMYVKVAGMKAGEFYRVTALDASDNEISMIEARANGEGVIDMLPLWYNVGLQYDADGNPYINMTGGLTTVGFKVNVYSLFDNGKTTDFTQDMFIVYSSPSTDTNPKPIIYSCYYSSLDNDYYPENAFKETGTLVADGNPDPKTKVYVKADRVPTAIGSTAITHVDFYVMSFTGEAFQDGDVLSGSDKEITAITGVAVTDGKVPGTLLWDLNAGPPLVNPDQDNMAYSIVMDVDQDGVFDKGVDTDSDGVSDYFVDGVDGNGEPGFIVQNTPANDIFVTIKDGTTADANIVNSIVENSAEVLYLTIDNVPLASTDTLGTFLINNFSGADQAALTGNDVRSTGNGDTSIGLTSPDTTVAGEVRYLPYLENRELFNDTGAGAWAYNGAALTADLSFDLIVDLDDDGVFDKNSDYLIEDAVVMFKAPVPDPVFATCSSSDGTNKTQYFDESNTENGKTIVYLNAQDAIAPYDVYVLSADGFAGLYNGDTLEWESMFSVTVTSGGNPSDITTEIWDINGTHKVINPKITNNTYYLVMDEDRDGLYDDGTDDTLTIVILNTKANAYPRVSYLNIASGGSFGNTYAQHWTLYSEYCDYRDLFDKTGAGTNYNGGGYGVKAVFNPYFSWFSNPNPETPEPNLYYGAYVDVYIVDAATFDLSDYGHEGELNDTVDVTGRHSTLVVQPSCYNGVGMMTIWPAQMTPGKYYVIVDVNRDGIINEGTDIIDAVNQDGTTIVDDATVVGFTVQ